MGLALGTGLAGCAGKMSADAAPPVPAVTSTGITVGSAVCDGAADGPADGPADGRRL